MSASTAQVCCFGFSALNHCKKVFRVGSLHQIFADMPAHHALQALAGCTQLVELDLKNCCGGQTGSGLAALSALTRLRVLSCEIRCVMPEHQE